MVKWAGTVDMNWKLCHHLGRDGAFPTPHEIQQSSAEFLRQKCRLGYRSEWIWELSDGIVGGKVDLKRLEASTCREDIAKELKKIKGVGAFASNNILQLMGYFDSHPYDTETVRLFREDFSITGSKKEIFVLSEER